MDLSEIDAILDSAKKPEKAVKLCLRSDLQSQWEKLELELQTEDKAEPATLAKAIWPWGAGAAAGSMFTRVTSAGTSAWSVVQNPGAPPMSITRSRRPSRCSTLAARSPRRRASSWLRRPRNEALSASSIDAGRGLESSRFGLLTGICPPRPPPAAPRDLTIR